MATPVRLNNSGLPLYHLTRIGPPATAPNVPDVMDLYRVTTVIGRNPLQADYALDSSNRMRSAYISRLHARIIRVGEDHKLCDDSLNGIFINHVKITGSSILQEGDLVTFGHPNGSNIPVGSVRRQSDSEYQFLFGRCDCPQASDPSVSNPGSSTTTAATTTTVAATTTTTVAATTTTATVAATTTTATTGFQVPAPLSSGSRGQTLTNRAQHQRTTSKSFTQTDMGNMVFAVAPSTCQTIEATGDGTHQNQEPTHSIGQLAKGSEPDDENSRQSCCQGNLQGIDLLGNKEMSACVQKSGADGNSAGVDNIDKAGSVRSLDKSANVNCDKVSDVEHCDDCCDSAGVKEEIIEGVSGESMEYDMSQDSAGERHYIYSDSVDYQAEFESWQDDNMELSGRDGTDTDVSIPVSCSSRTEGDGQSEAGLTDEAPIEVIIISSESDSDDVGPETVAESTSPFREKMECFEICGSDEGSSQVEVLPLKKHTVDNVCIENDHEPVFKKPKLGSSRDSDTDSPTDLSPSTASVFSSDVSKLKKAGASESAKRPVFKKPKLESSRDSDTYGSTDLCPSKSYVRSTVVSQFKKSGASISTPKKESIKTWCFSAPIAIASPTHKFSDSSQESSQSSEDEDILSQGLEVVDKSPKHNQRCDFGGKTSFQSSTPSIKIGKDAEKEKQILSSAASDKTLRSLEHPTHEPGTKTNIRTAVFEDAKMEDINLQKNSVCQGSKLEKAISTDDIQSSQSSEDITDLNLSSAGCSVATDFVEQVLHHAKAALEACDEMHEHDTGENRSSSSSHSPDGEDCIMKSTNCAAEAGELHETLTEKNDCDSGVLDSHTGDIDAIRNEPSVFTEEQKIQNDESDMDKGEDHPPEDGVSLPNIVEKDLSDDTEKVHLQKGCQPSSPNSIASNQLATREAVKFDQQVTEMDHHCSPKQNVLIMDDDETVYDGASEVGRPENNCQGSSANSIETVSESKTEKVMTNDKPDDNVNHCSSQKDFESSQVVHEKECVISQVQHQDDDSLLSSPVSLESKIKNQDVSVEILDKADDHSFQASDETSDKYVTEIDYLSSEASTAAKETLKTIEQEIEECMSELVLKASHLDEETKRLVVPEDASNSSPHSGDEEIQAPSNVDMDSTDYSDTSPTVDASETSISKESEPSKEVVSNKYHPDMIKLTNEDHFASAESYPSALVATDQTEVSNEDSVHAWNEVNSGLKSEKPEKSFSQASDISSHADDVLPLSTETQSESASISEEVSEPEENKSKLPTGNLASVTLKTVCVTGGKSVDDPSEDVEFPETDEQLENKDNSTLLKIHRDDSRMEVEMEIDECSSKVQEVDEFGKVDDQCSVDEVSGLGTPLTQVEASQGFALTSCSWSFESQQLEDSVPTEDNVEEPEPMVSVSAESLINTDKHEQGIGNTVMDILSEMIANAVSKGNGEFNVKKNETVQPEDIAVEHESVLSTIVSSEVSTRRCGEDENNSDCIDTTSSSSSVSEQQENGCDSMPCQKEETDSSQLPQTSICEEQTSDKACPLSAGSKEVNISSEMEQMREHVIPGPVTAEDNIDMLAVCNDLVPSGKEKLGTDEEVEQTGTSFEDNDERTTRNDISEDVSAERNNVTEDIRTETFCLTDNPSQDEVDENSSDLSQGEIKQIRDKLVIQDPLTIEDKSLPVRSDMVPAADDREETEKEMEETEIPSEDSDELTPMDDIWDEDMSAEPDDQGLCDVENYDKKDLHAGELTDLNDEKVSGNLRTEITGLTGQHLPYKIQDNSCDRSPGVSVDDGCDVESVVEQPTASMNGEPREGLSVKKVDMSGTHECSFEVEGHDTSDNTSLEQRIDNVSTQDMDDSKRTKENDTDLKLNKSSQETDVPFKSESFRNSVISKSDFEYSQKDGESDPLLDELVGESNSGDELLGEFNSRDELLGESNSVNDVELSPVISLQTAGVCEETNKSQTSVIEDKPVLEQEDYGDSYPDFHLYLSQAGGHAEPVMSGEVECSVETPDHDTDSFKDLNQPLPGKSPNTHQYTVAADQLDVEKDRMLPEDADPHDKLKNVNLVSGETPVDQLSQRNEQEDVLDDVMNDQTQHVRTSVTDVKDDEHLCEDMQKTDAGMKSEPLVTGDGSQNLGKVSPGREHCLSNATQDNLPGVDLSMDETLTDEANEEAGKTVESQVLTSTGEEFCGSQEVKENGIGEKTVTLEDDELITGSTGTAGTLPPTNVCQTNEESTSRIEQEIQSADMDVTLTEGSLLDEEGLGKKFLFKSSKDIDTTYSSMSLEDEFLASTPKRQTSHDPQTLSSMDSLVVNFDDSSYQKNVSGNSSSHSEKTVSLEDKAASKADSVPSLSVDNFQDDNEKDMSQDEDDMNRNGDNTTVQEVLRGAVSAEENDFHLHLSGIESQTSDVESCSGFSLSQPGLSSSRLEKHKLDNWEEGEDNILNKTLEEDDKQLANKGCSPLKITTSEEDALLSDEDLCLEIAASDESQLIVEESVNESTENNSVLFVSPVLKFGGYGGTIAKELVRKSDSEASQVYTGNPNNTQTSDIDTSTSQINLLAVSSQDESKENQTSTPERFPFMEESGIDSDVSCSQEYKASTSELNMSGVTPFEESADECESFINANQDQTLVNSLSEDEQSNSGPVSAMASEDSPVCTTDIDERDAAEVTETKVAKIPHPNVETAKAQDESGEKLHNFPSAIKLYSNPNDSEPTFIAEPLFRVDENNMIIFDALEKLVTDKPEKDKKVNAAVSQLCDARSEQKGQSSDTTIKLYNSPTADEVVSASEGMVENPVCEKLKGGNEVHSRHSITESGVKFTDEIDVLEDVPVSEGALESPVKENIGVTVSKQNNVESVADEEVLDNMKMMNYTDSVPDSEDCMIIELGSEDTSKSKCDAVISCSQIRKQEKYEDSCEPSDKTDCLPGTGETDGTGVSPQEPDYSYMHDVSKSQDQANRISETDEDLRFPQGEGQIESKMETPNKTDDVPERDVDGKSELTGEVKAMEENQFMPVIKESCSVQPEGRKRKASDDENGERKRSCHDQDFLVRDSSLLRRLVSGFFRTREHLKHQETGCCDENGNSVNRSMIACSMEKQISGEHTPEKPYLSNSEDKINDVQDSSSTIMETETVEVKQEPISSPDIGQAAVKMEPDDKPDKSQCLNMTFENFNRDVKMEVEIKSENNDLLVNDETEHYSAEVKREFHVDFKSADESSGLLESNLNPSAVKEEISQVKKEDSSPVVSVSNEGENSLAIKSNRMSYIIDENDEVIIVSDSGSEDESADSCSKFTKSDDLAECEEKVNNELVSLDCEEQIMESSNDDGTEQGQSYGKSIENSDTTGSMLDLALVSSEDYEVYTDDNTPEFSSQDKGTVSVQDSYSLSVHTSSTTDLSVGSNFTLMSCSDKGSLSTSPGKCSETSGISVHTLDSEYDSDVYITECNLVPDTSTVKSEELSSDDENDDFDHGRHRKTAPGFSSTTESPRNKVSLKEGNASRKSKSSNRTDERDDDVEICEDLSDDQRDDSKGFDTSVVPIRSGLDHCQSSGEQVEDETETKAKTGTNGSTTPLPSDNEEQETSQVLLLTGNVVTGAKSANIGLVSTSTKKICNSLKLREIPIVSCNDEHDIAVEVNTSDTVDQKDDKHAAVLSTTSLNTELDAIDEVKEKSQNKLSVKKCGGKVNSVQDDDPELPSQSVTSGSNSEVLSGTANKTSLEAIDHDFNVSASFETRQDGKLPDQDLSAEVSTADTSSFCHPRDVSLSSSKHHEENAELIPTTDIVGLDQTLLGKDNTTVSWPTKNTKSPLSLDVDFSEDTDSVCGTEVNVKDIIAGLMEEDLTLEPSMGTRSASLDDIFDKCSNEDPPTLEDNKSTKTDKTSDFLSLHGIETSTKDSPCQEQASRSSVTTEGPEKFGDCDEDMTTIPPDVPIIDQAVSSKAVTDIFDQAASVFTETPPRSGSAAMRRLSSRSSSQDSCSILERRLIDSAEIILDIQLPENDGHHACKSLGRITPETRKDAVLTSPVLHEEVGMSPKISNQDEGSFSAVEPSPDDDEIYEDFPLLSRRKRCRSPENSKDSDVKRQCVDQSGSGDDSNWSVALPENDFECEMVEGINQENCSNSITSDVKPAHDIPEPYNSGESSKSKTSLDVGTDRFRDMETVQDDQSVASTHQRSVEDLSSTQLSQLDRRLAASKNPENVKKRRLLEKIRAKRKSRLESKGVSVRLGNQADVIPPQHTTPGDLPAANSTQRNIFTSQAQQSLERVEGYIQRCKKVTSLLKQALHQNHQLKDMSTVKIWREELQSLNEKVELPKTVIAVVGDTGSGKSSMLNALLDQPCVLPTSGIEACTAVVVEVVENTNNTKYEADIHFLSCEEWNDELRVLLKDLTKLNGTLQKKPPDPNSEAGVAFAKVRAVYGKVEQLEVLQRQTPITRWLGKVKRISVSNAKKLRDEVNMYIESTDTGTRTGQYWPVIKKVKLFLPSCDVCSSGAILVDLPGVRDANAARDRIAREYLKNSTSVWVVAAIHRAKDNRTAKELLDENFRRQLLMDGQCGSVAFICTKTDSLIPSELKKLLPLPAEFDILNDKVSQLDMEICELLQEKKASKGQREFLVADLEALTTEYEDMDQVISEAREEQLLEEDESQKEEIYELEKDLQDKDEEIKMKQAQVRKLQAKEDEIQKKISVIRAKRDDCHRNIAVMCAKARNDHSMKQIKRGFRAGIRELKRRSITVSEEEDILDYDDGGSDIDDDEETGNIIENLKVFCTSSADYLKMKKLLADADGGPKVFSSPEETQIPALREYVHSTTLKRRERGAKHIVEKVGHFVFNIDNYLRMSEYGKKEFHQARPLVTRHLKTMMTEIEKIVTQLDQDISRLYQTHLVPKLEEGSQVAAQKAKSTSEKWGDKVNKDNRKLGGLHSSTYRATVRRFGKYNSKSAGSIDFNEQLSEPVMVALSCNWDKVFSSLMWKTLDKVNIAMLSALQTFSQDIQEDFVAMNFDMAQIENVVSQIIRTAKAKLNEMNDLMKEYITSQQREISRIVTPQIQVSMSGTYEAMNNESGGGCFMRMKNIMSNDINRKCYIMFEDSTSKIKNRLSDLQKSVCEKVKGVLTALCKSFKMTFEPLWQSPSSCENIKKYLDESISQCTVLISKLYQDIGLPLPVRAEAPESDLDTSVSLEPEETVEAVLGALRHDVEDQRRRLETGSGDDDTKMPYFVKKQNGGKVDHPMKSEPDDAFYFSRHEQETAASPGTMSEVVVQGNVKCGTMSECVVWQTGKLVIKLEAGVWWCCIHQDNLPGQLTSYMVCPGNMVRVTSTPQTLILELNGGRHVFCHSADTHSVQQAYTLLLKIQDAAPEKPSLVMRSLMTGKQVVVTGVGVSPSGKQTAATSRFASHLLSDIIHIASDSSTQASTNRDATPTSTQNQQSFLSPSATRVTSASHRPHSTPVSTPVSTPLPTVVSPHPPMSASKRTSSTPSSTSPHLLPLISPPGLCRTSASDQSKSSPVALSVQEDRHQVKVAAASMKTLPSPKQFSLLQKQKTNHSAVPTRSPIHPKLKMPMNKKFTNPPQVNTLATSVGASHAAISSLKAGNVETAIHASGSYGSRGVRYDHKLGKHTVAKLSKQSPQSAKHTTSASSPSSSGSNTKENISTFGPRGSTPTTTAFMFNSRDGVSPPKLGPPTVGKRESVSFSRLSLNARSLKRPLHSTQSFPVQVKQEPNEVMSPVKKKTFEECEVIDLTEDSDIESDDHSTNVDSGRDDRSGDSVGDDSSINSDSDDDLRSYLD